MSQTLFPDQGWCHRVERFAKSFLWKGNLKDRFWHPVSRKKVCKSKNCGELGLRRLEDMNKAFLAKLGWFLAVEEDCLWVRALKAKYFPSSSFLNYRKSKGYSGF
ncbi:hypothetical protein FEM48_Zijuj02G0095300 [Ziziphus jujuba var. spinosa]|uniref:Uncharacterized protein n=1 Tax=Ziziphus jujuba var. spinosa TaxID=714518 RepID=A0A978VUZ2_ZIZJJ|nr:hypothetical protein FEM48_Zijuj02G0095300 [Ziziphus jujuba var. spinosa]